MQKEAGKRGCRVFPENGGGFSNWGEIKKALDEGKILFVKLTDTSEIQAYPMPVDGMLARIMDVDYFEFENPVAPEPSGFLPIVKVLLKTTSFNTYNKELLELEKKKKNGYPREIPKNGMVQISVFGDKFSPANCLTVIAADFQ